jgi:hypothetical protein
MRAISARDASLSTRLPPTHSSAMSGVLVLDWKGKRTRLKPVDERLFAGRDRISVGLLPGEPTMISVNDFILIGARPGARTT